MTFVSLSHNRQRCTLVFLTMCSGLLVKGEGAASLPAQRFPPDHNTMTDIWPSTMQLPKQLAEIEGIVGRDAAVKLANSCGGTRVYIPAKLPVEHWLIEAIGSEAAHKLSAYFTFGRRGISLDIPMIPRSLHVQDLTDAGASAREIALKLGIHQRTVHRNRRKPAPVKRGSLGRS